MARNWEAAKKKTYRRGKNTTKQDSSPQESVKLSFSRCRKKKIGFNPTKFALVIPCRDANSRGGRKGGGRPFSCWQAPRLFRIRSPPGWKVSPGKAEEAEQMTLEKSNSIKGNLTGPLKRQRKNKGDSKHKDTPLAEKRTEGRDPPAGLQFYSIFSPLLRFFSPSLAIPKRRTKQEKKKRRKVSPGLYRDCSSLIFFLWFSSFVKVSCREALIWRARKMTLRTYCRRTTGNKVGWESRESNWDSRVVSPPAVSFPFLLFFSPLYRRGRSLPMMNRDKEKEKRGERGRESSVPRLLWQSLVMRGVGRLANKEGSVQTRSFGAQRVFAEKSSKCRRWCTGVVRSLITYLLTLHPLRWEVRRKKKWSGVERVCVPRLLRFRAAVREAQQFLSPPSFFCLPPVEGGGRKREQESTDIVITCKFSILFLRGGGKGSSSRLPRTSHFFLSFLLFCFSDVFLSPVSPFRKTATTVQ